MQHATKMRKHWHIKPNKVANPDKLFLSHELKRGYFHILNEYNSTTIDFSPLMSFLSLIHSVRPSI